MEAALVGVDADARLDRGMVERAVCRRAAGSARPRPAGGSDALEMTVDSEDSDAIAKVLGGNVDAFEGLVRKYERAVFSIVVRHVPYDRVEEVAHGVFLRAFRSLGHFREEKPFGHWLACVASRACCDFWREQKRRREIPLAVFPEEQAEWVQDVLSEQSVDKFRGEERARRAREILDWALSRLAPADRMALTLVHLEGYSVKEAADLLGLSVANTKVRSFRARRALREMLKKTLEHTGETT